jgi:hypothetical protein
MCSLMREAARSSAQEVLRRTRRIRSRLENQGEAVGEAEPQKKAPEGAIRLGFRDNFA